MQRLFIAFITFIAILTASLGAFIFISLLPHITLIGWAAAALLCVAIGCCAVLLINFTYTRISVNQSHRQHAQLMRNVVLFESGAAAFINGEFHHLSAEHQRAMVALPPVVVKELPSPKKVEGWSDKQTCIDMWLETGQSQQAIADQLSVPKSRVQKWLSDYKKEQGLD